MSNEDEFPCEEFTAEEKKWIEPLAAILKNNGVRCQLGSLALLCDIHRLYTGKPEEKSKKLAEYLVECSGTYDSLAKGAKKYFLERLPDVCGMGLNYRNAISEVKKMIEEA